MEGNSRNPHRACSDLIDEKILKAIDDKSSVIK